MSDEEVRDYLREMRDDPVPADSLARVRMRVEERTGRRPWFGAWWRAAIVVPLPVLSILLILLLRREPPVASTPPAKPQPVVQTRPATESPSMPGRVLVRRVPPPPKPLPQPAPRKPEVSNMVRIETEDPDVVIMLIAE